MELKDLYLDDYFSNRLENDQRRRISFEQERSFIKKHVKFDGVCLDVGCSTGEFLNCIGWEGTKFGIEISDAAAAKAKLSGVTIVKSYEEKHSLDAVFYRGTIQHLDAPFGSLRKAVHTLKPDGKLFFLATPNVDSPYYRMFGTLPALDPARNFYLPSKSSLINICRIFGFELIDQQYPYLDSPYSSVVKDHVYFLIKVLGHLPFLPEPDLRFPFWRSMMNLTFVKSER